MKVSVIASSDFHCHLAIHINCVDSCEFVAIVDVLGDFFQYLWEPIIPIYPPVILLNLLVLFIFDI